MIKDELTTSEAKIAVLYLQRQLNNQNFQISEKNNIDAIEKEFPLFYLPENRRWDRKTMLDRVYRFSKENYFQCCSAIRCFSKLLFAQQTLQIYLPKLNEQNKLPKELREDARSLYNLLEMNGTIQNNKIKNIYFHLIVELNDFIEKILSKLKHNSSLDPFLVEAEKHMLTRYLIDQAGNEFLSKYHFYNIEPKICSPQNLILDSLIWIIFIKFFAQQSCDEARKSTADLINEYCYENPFFRNKPEGKASTSLMVRKLTQNSIKHVLYKTDYKDGKKTIPFLKALQKEKKSRQAFYMPKS